MTGNTIVTWERTPESTLLLIGKAVQGGPGGMGGGGGMSIINPNWDFTQMGIGGLDKEFSAIFRRTFASRMFPPEVSQQLGMSLLWCNCLVCILRKRQVTLRDHIEAKTEYYI